MRIQSRREGASPRITAAPLPCCALRQCGITLLELIILLTVVSILASIAVASFNHMTARNRIVTSANHLLSALITARTIAITHNAPVTFCAGNATDGCNGNWKARKWIVFTDHDHDGQIDPDDDLHITGHLPPSSRVKLSGNGPFKKAVVFKPSGEAQTLHGAFAAGRLRVCVATEIESNATDLVLIGSGRTVSEPHDFGGTCPAAGR